MSIQTKSKLIDICSNDPSQYYQDIMDLNDNMIEQFKLAKKKGLLPNYLIAPALMMWEITSKCPQKCIYCYNLSSRKSDELSSNQLFQVADQIIEAKPFNICISGGEPTMRPEYYDLIRYLASSGILVGTILSGANIDKTKAFKIARCAKAVQVSLDGSTAEIHDNVRRRRGSYDDALKTIKYFVDFGVNVNISFAASKLNIDDFPRFHEFMTELGVSSIRTQKLAISGRAKGHEDTIRPTAEQYKNFLGYINSSKNKKMCKIEFGDPSVHISSGLDFGLSVLARINSEGYVGITPYLDIYFGNLKNESLKNIWSKMKNGWTNQEVVKMIQSKVKLQETEIIDNMDNRLIL